MQNPNSAERHASPPAIEYDNSRYQNLMKEYCEIKTFGDYKKWKVKAQELASYISGIKSKVDPLIVADQEKLAEKLEHTSDEREKMALQMNASHFANFGVFL